MPSLGQALLQAKDFLLYLTTVRGDLSNITAPPALLSTKSVTEFPATWAAHHSLFLAQAASSDPAERALAVLKNFLCSLQSQTYTGRSKEEGLKKPLNAFLGEVFVGVFEDEGGSTKVWSEQVSHHPPVTACALVNVIKGISAEGYIAQETTFSMTHGLRVSQIGHALIHVSAHNESHLLTLPTLNLKGMLSGSPYPELSGTCHIVSTSGYTSRIDFSGKKTFSSSSKRNTLHATLYKTDDPIQTPLYEVEGQWNDTLTITSPHGAKETETLHIDSIPTTPISLPPLSNQDPWESRRAWDAVVSAISENNMSRTAAEKAKIEEAQRAMRKVEREQGVEWPRMFFRREEDGAVGGRASLDRERRRSSVNNSVVNNNTSSSAKDRRKSSIQPSSITPTALTTANGTASNPNETYTHLASTISHSLQEDKTDGVWRFIGFEAAQRIERPLHRGLEPTGQVAPG